MQTFENFALFSESFQPRYLTFSFIFLFFVDFFGRALGFDLTFDFNFLETLALLVLFGPTNRSRLSVTAPGIRGLPQSASTLKR